MTADELRELAQKIEEKWWRWKDNPTIELKAAAYLRACADALEKGPVAWRIRIPGESELGHWFGEVPLGEGYNNEALYPVAMPAQPVAAENTSAGSVAETAEREHIALRLPEPMTEAAVEHFGRRALMGHLPVRELIRAIEAETLRRVKEVNK